MFGVFGSQRDHICGCYYLVAHERQYLPQVISEFHTTISSISFATQLKQTFSNPSTQNLPKVRYTFPLYDGIVVSGYTITYAGKTLKGIVRQNDDAKQIYQAAVDKGDTAGLLEALPAGCFGVTLGNVPPGQDITVVIDYCGELEHDSQIDGLRFILPTSIAPRYGSYPGKLLESNVATKGGIRVTVDIDMLGSAIRKVQSPSHPLAVTLGELSSGEGRDSAAFSSSQASATLTLGSVELADDFVLQILVHDIGNPKVVIETHPTIPNLRAIMTTLVPKFALAQAKPEIVFIADQSGSMSGSKNHALIAALKIFLKSLPLGVRFNICAFGNRFQFLWPKSVAYSEDNLNTAVDFVDGFNASYGGTELLEPIRQTFERQLKDLTLEIMLLTDGQIWGESQVFDFINEQIGAKGVDARVFALGIGQEVSHTLVEGIARAGNGFAQFAQSETEEIDQKIMRMLKGALYAHTKDYTLKVNYQDSDKMPDDDSFEIVDKVNGFLNIDDHPAEAESRATAVKPKSFFDPSADLDGKTDTPGRYEHLPDLQIPAVIQAPASIPPLFPFNRTNVYLLLGPDSPQKVVSSVTLRATSSDGPLELDIPVHTVEPGTIIHQLAARKAIQDLEEGRGWLQSATIVDPAGLKQISVKEKYESRFDEIVEREAVRLGEKFCVAGKFTSFVAVSDHLSEDIKEDEPQAAFQPNYNFTTQRKYFAGGPAVKRKISPDDVAKSAFSEQYSSTASLSTSPLPMNRGGSALMVTAARSAAPMMSMMDAQMRAPVRSYARNPGPISAYPGHPPMHKEIPLKGSAINQIISLQTFSGAWSWGDELLGLVGKDESEIDIAALGNDKDVAATVLAVAFLETRVHSKKDVWSFIVEKGKMWLTKEMGGDAAKVEELIRVAAKSFLSS